MTQPDSSLPPQTAAPEADARHDWITNEGLLRDEGVLFGLAHAASGPQADAMLAAKLESIDAAFALRKARAAQDRAKAQAPRLTAWAFQANGRALGC